MEIVNANWEQVERFIPQAFARRPDLVVDVAAMVEAGAAAAFLLREGKTDMGALVLDGGGDALRVLALAGDSGADLIQAVDAWVGEVARQAGCSRVIIHTVRVGMVASLVRRGWSLDIANLSRAV